eukprot:jgi/Ulvmu1/11665/UM008_0071.1
MLFFCRPRSLGPSLRRQRTTPTKRPPPNAPRSGFGSVENTYDDLEEIQRMAYEDANLCGDDFEGPVGFVGDYSFEDYMLQLYDGDEAAWAAAVLATDGDTGICDFSFELVETPEVAVDGLGAAGGEGVLVGALDDGDDGPVGGEDVAAADVGEDGPADNSGDKAPLPPADVGDTPAADVDEAPAVDAEGAPAVAAGVSPAVAGGDGEDGAAAMAPGAGMEDGEDGDDAGTEFYVVDDREAVPAQEDGAGDEFDVYMEAPADVAAGGVGGAGDGR